MNEGMKGNQNDFGLRDLEFDDHLFASNMLFIW